MALQIGLNVVEVDARVTPALRAAPTSVAGFPGLTRRGVPGRPVLVTSLDQFVDRFGGHLPDSYLAYAVTGFFLNGGRAAYVVRVAGAGAVAAAATLLTPAPARPSLRVTAGYRGDPDPGTWAAGLRIDVRDDPKGSTTVTSVSGTAVVLASLAGIEVGSVLRVPGAGFRKVTAVDRVTNTVTVATAVGAVAAGTIVTTAEFRLVVRLQDDATKGFPVVEDWRGLSMEPGTADYVVDRLNHPRTGSRYVIVADVGDDPPAVTSGVMPTGGADGNRAAGDLVTALSTLDTVAVQLVAVPDAHLFPSDRAQVTRRAIDYCAARGDCVYVGSAPDGDSPGGYVDTVRAYSTQFQAAKVYGALYAPWITVADPAGTGSAPVRPVPPDGHVLGVYARTEQERTVFKAPAGTAATLRGALAVTVPISDAQLDDLVKLARVNGIRGGTPFVAASRTLSTDPRWYYVGTRLLFNFVKATLRDGLRFVRQEPHTDDLRRAVRLTVVTPFLLGLWRQGAFGPGAPEQAFTVKCDAENNPPSEVDAGNFRLEVSIFPSSPAETVQIVVGQQPAGGTAAEL